ncbi:MAG: Sulfoxide reductase catalytic subunit YedY [Thermoproteota archaeon]|nr:Sulfoxide reductase catalytic subunit YedY [Thermoproteota archaeon]
MVFSELHWVPSVVAAVLTILFAFVKDKRRHKLLSYVLFFFAAIGIIGYASNDGISLLFFDVHTLHYWLGIVALLLSISTFVDGALFKKGKTKNHCNLGRLTAVFSCLALLIGLLLLMGFNIQPRGLPTVQLPVSNILPEVEVTEFQDIRLTPLSEQRNNAIKGTQYLNRSSYRLSVVGLVENELSYSYEDLLKLPAYAEVAYMPCVEGWGFTAKWTGFKVNDLLDIAKLQPNATYIVFRSSDGYATGLPIGYLKSNQTLMAYGINDLTLPPERGFPFQLVAVDKYGYKWAKWVTDIEVGDEVVAGYWESRGYSNSADVGTPPFI